MKKKFFAPLGIAVLVVLATVWAAPRDSEAHSWAPFFGPPNFYALNPATPDANGDTLANFNVFAPSANFTALFGGAITFGDPNVFTASAADIPNNGAFIGTLGSVATLGLINSGCNNNIDVNFGFAEAEVAIQVLPMNGAPTLSANITAAATSFTYNSAIDPIGPPDLGGITRSEIEIDNEQMLVTAVDEGTNTYTVVRGYNGTTPASHNSGAAIDKLNVIYPSGPPANLLANLAEDDGDLDNNGVPEFTALNNNIADGADAIPSFVRDGLDPDGTGAPGTTIGYQQAHARYAGIAFVADTLVVILQFVLFSPGQLTAFPNLQWATADWGYASTTFLQDPFAPPSNSGITDFCNFSTNTNFVGVPRDNSCTSATPPLGCTQTGAGFTLQHALDGGCPGGGAPNECGNQNGGAAEIFRSKNPGSAEGCAVSCSVRYYQYSISQRDTDADSHDNALDPCFYAANPLWDPRAANLQLGEDDDGDGLPNPCDPNDADGVVDADLDSWVNRLDACPTNADGANTATPNTQQFDQDWRLGAPFPAGQANNSVPDGGPRSDSIGPTCDVNPNWPDGHYHATAAASTICIGPVGSNCSESADADNDGVVNATDTCINGSNPPFGFPHVYEGPPGKGQSVLAGAVGAGANTISITDGHSSRFTLGQPIIIGAGGTRETLRYITGISPTTPGVADTITFADFGAGGSILEQSLVFAHGAGEAVAMVAYSQSLRDVTGDGNSDISDISALAGAFNKQGGVFNASAGYQGRYDTDYDSDVDISDVSAMAGTFNKFCGP